MMEIRSIEQLQAQVNANQKFNYLFFWGHQQKDNKITQSCFSQWYEASFEVKGIAFKTAEHFMMAEKAKLFGDQVHYDKIIHATNPGDAKALGRQVRGYEDERWIAHRFDIVVQANLEKFSQNPALSEYLLGTGKKVLVEASPVDRIWGIGLAADDPKALNPNSWCGLNLLGFALMEVRQQLSKKI
ncbi:NADAR family protein [Pleionea sp. CnH1-48]|uniref:NADAR family protein n=1 Tax=Pleionea sp. CnH1-48 TaxID=2954494 RepID=UPI0020968FBD|nr:NADAR family protein [Pleionea sp. CnH1-48]MCO7225190.1 NADAR family protein [Pleionea sp. CnH1-48]